MEGISRIWKGRAAYLFVLPAFLLFSVFLVKPMIECIMLSFYDVGFKGSTFIGFANYTEMFSSFPFWNALKNTLMFVLVVVPAKVILAFGIAFMLSRYGHGVQSFFKGMFYLPVISAGVVMTTVWWWIFDPLYGPLNYLLSLIGLGPVMWLSESSWAFRSVVVVLLNWQVGIGVILYSSAIAAIPKDIFEAADIDGAGLLRKLFKITVPLVLPITVFILVISTVGMFQVWQVVFLLTRGGPAYSTTSLVYQIYTLGFMNFDFGQASAYATILLMMTFTIAFFQFRWLNKEVEF